MNEILDPLELNKVLGKSEGKDFTCSKILPQREWLDGVITKVVYRFSMFKGMPVYIEDTDGNAITDRNGDKIQRREFLIELTLSNHKCDSGEPRKLFLKIGSSLGQKSHLPKLLNELGMNMDEELTPQKIMDFMKDLIVRFQIKHGQINDRTGRPFENVIWDSLQLKDYQSGSSVTIEDVNEEWEE